MDAILQGLPHVIRMLPRRHSGNGGNQAGTLAEFGGGPQSPEGTWCEAEARQVSCFLRSFLGLIKYYGKFISSLASTLYPLHMLLRANQPWKWTEECEKAFQDAKKSVTLAPVLVHYDPDLPITLATDTSATLSGSERNYVQIEKEALSIVFGIKKFHPYLYGRGFSLITDHKPLTSILGLNVIMHRSRRRLY